MDSVSEVGFSSTIANILLVYKDSTNFQDAHRQDTSVSAEQAVGIDEERVKG
jgi:hypothetical protein